MVPPRQGRDGRQLDGKRDGLQECAGVVEKENGHEADERRGHGRGQLPHHDHAPPIAVQHRPGDEEVSDAEQEYQSRQRRHGRPVALVE